MLIIALVFVFNSLGKDIQFFEFSTLPTIIILAPVLLIALFLILREFHTWYWKINKAIELLEKIEKNTRK